MYNVTFFNTSNTLGDVLVGVNQMTGGTLFGVMLIALWFISFIVLKRFDTADAFMVSNFIVLVVSILSWAAEFIEYYIVIVPLVLLIISILMKFIGNQGGN